MKTIPVLIVGFLFWEARPARGEDAPLVMDLWPGPAPGNITEPADDDVIPAKPDENPPTLRLTNVTRPQISVYRPAADKNIGVVIVILPGGGFNHLAYDKEGTEAAQWLQTLGITGIVLKYRCPTKQDRATQHIKPLQDAQRAMSLVRTRADEWDIDAQQVGIMGFSAGGHVAARLAFHPGHREYEPVDEVDDVPWRPAFAVLLYPAYLMNRAETGLDSAAFQVTDRSPPTFLSYAWDDRIPSPGALHLAIALREVGVSCELHQYATGGHGYGLRPADSPAVTWPAQLEDWMRSSGLTK